MLLKTVHKRFPCQLLGNRTLQRGEWVAHTAENEGIKFQAYRFKNLKVKDFTSTCSTALPGNPRKTSKQKTLIGIYILSMVSLQKDTTRKSKGGTPGISLFDIYAR